MQTCKIYISLADMEIKSCESVSNAPCKSHTKFTCSPGYISVTEATTIQPHFYRHLKSFNYHFLRLVDLCCIHSSDFKVSIAVTKYICIYQSGSQKLLKPYLVVMVTHH